MIHLTTSQHRALAQVRDAGPDGVSFDDVNLGDAVALALDHLVRPDQSLRRVYITARGAAFLNRVTA